MKDLEKIYKALANRRRLQIIIFLKKHSEATVGDIADHLKLSFKSTSRHLAVLRNANILDKEQKGLSAFYSIQLPKHSVIQHLLSII